ncbi:MAG: T9SS type A sorting domain-containing protein [Bacteroidota bacterium]
MKKILLIAILFVFAGMITNAQTVLFEDDFEDYFVGDILIEGDVYPSFTAYPDAEGWFINDVGRTTEILADSVDGVKVNQYAYAAKTSNAGYGISMQLELEAGKDYAFVVNAKSFAAKNLKLQVWAYESDNKLADSVVNNLGDTIFWETDSLLFTPNPDTLMTVFSVSTWPTKHTWVDNWMVVDITGVGVEEVQAMNFSVYPNPTSGNFKISGLESIASYSVYNITGQIVKRASVDQNEVDVDLSDYPKGLYMIEAKNRKGISAVSKIILQ